MKVRYTAHSPADSDDAIAQGDLTLPNTAGTAAVIGALVNEVQKQAVADPGSQMRVIAWHRDEPEPFVWHTWDHA